jgi:hypothetical protein
MKKIITICLLVFFTIAGNAQINNKTKIKELNQDQLNIALEYIHPFRIYIIWRVDFNLK